MKYLLLPGKRRLRGQLPWASMPARVRNPKHPFDLNKSTRVIHLQIAKEVNLSKPFRALTSDRLVDNITKTSAHAQKTVTHTWRKKGGTWVSQQLRCVIRSSQGTIFTIIFYLFLKGSWESRNLTEKLSSYLKPDDLVFFPATATSPLLTSWKKCSATWIANKRK